MSIKTLKQARLIAGQKAAEALVGDRSDAYTSKSSGSYRGLISKRSSGRIQSPLRKRTPPQNSQAFSLYLGLGLLAEGPADHGWSLFRAVSESVRVGPALRLCSCARPKGTVSLHNLCSCGSVPEGPERSDGFGIKGLTHRTTRLSLENSRAFSLYLGLGLFADPLSTVDGVRN